MVPNQSSIAPVQDAPVWLNESTSIDDWLSGADSSPIAVDTEFVRERTYWPQLALVQLALPNERLALIDPLASASLTALGQQLSGPERTILMHSAGEDLIALKPLLSAPMLGLYDTQIAAAFAGLGLGLGYQAAVEQLVGVRLEKQETRSNWLTRPLSERQIIYALDDVRYLHALHAQLDACLDQRGYRDWHREDCRRLAQSGFDAAPDPQPQLAFRSAWRWPLAAQAQLRRVLLWREERARSRDLPRRWVLDDDSAFAAAIEPNHSAARLAARIAGGPLGKQRSLQALLNLIEHPPGPDDIEATQAIPAPPDGDLKHTVKRLKAEVDAEAARLDLPAGLLCPRRAIEALAMTGDWPAELVGWREEVLRSKLVALI